MRDDKIRESYSSLLDLPYADPKAKIEGKPEPIVKLEKGRVEIPVERPREKKGLFGPRKARYRGPRRQGMPPPPGEPTPPTPPSKPKLALPEDWANEDRYPIGHTKSAAARILGIDRKTVRRWAKKGILNELPTRRISLESIKHLKESKK